MAILNRGSRNPGKLRGCLNKDYDVLTLLMTITGLA